MANREKTALRLRKVHERLCRKKYPKKPALRRLVKLEEEWERLIKWSDHIWGRKYAHAFKPGIDNTNPAFAADFKELAQVETLKEKNRQSLYRLETKSGYTAEAAVQLTQRLNTARLTRSF